jgi:hypothetical protein
VCGATQEACWQGASRLLTPADLANPTGAFLYNAVRKPDGTGNMPDKSTYVFQPLDLALIDAWLAEGALDN